MHVDRDQRAMDQVAYLRASRRQTLAIRTITVTLRSALDTLARTDTALSPSDQIRMRREWCERARVALQAVQAEVMRHRALLARPTQPAEARRADEALDAVTADADAYIGRLERAS